MKPVALGSRLALLITASFSALFNIVDPPAAHAAAKVSTCQDPGPRNCTCMHYSYPSGSYIEWRCGDSLPPIGWRGIPPAPSPPPNRGSFGGDGVRKSRSNPPYQPIPSQYAARFAAIKGIAGGKLNGTRVWEIEFPPTFGPDTCTSLFAGNLLGSSGKDLLGSYVEFRFAPPGTPACSADIAFVRRHRHHDPFIVLCPVFFSSENTQAANQALALVLIHELLHVAGQQEDPIPNQATGPSDPPSTYQLSEAVSAACTNPEPLF